MERLTFKDAPGVYQALKQGQNHVDHCGLDRKLIELMNFRISQINSCAYSQEEIANLTMAVIQMNSWNRLGSFVWTYTGSL